MAMSFKLEGLEETVRNLGELPKAAGRNVLRRVLKKAGEPVAEAASRAAPRGETGRLIVSIVVATQLTRRHRGAKLNEVEVYIGPQRGQGVLNYATFVEYGTIDTVAQPFMRSAWDSKQDDALNIIKSELTREVERAATRLGRKTARLAAGG